MQIPQKFKDTARTVWQGLTVVVGGLLAVDFLVCLIAALADLNWLLNQYMLMIFTAVLLLAGIVLFLPRKAMGVGKLPRRLLGAGLIGGGLVLIFYVVMFVAAFFAMLDYIKQVKSN